MNKAGLKIGGRYNWVGQPERLVYMGAKQYPGDRRTWHQFALIDKPDDCWCEVLDSDLSSFEETKATAIERAEWAQGMPAGAVLGIHG